MSSRVKAAVWTDENTRSNSDQAGIEEGAVAVDIHAFTESKANEPQRKAKGGRDVLETGTIINFDRAVNIYFILKENEFILLR